VRCKLDLMIWRRLVLRFCIRPLNGGFVLLAIMDSFAMLSLVTAQTVASKRGVGGRISG
jgi:hypothetical protein